MPQRSIYTVGHSTLALEAFLGLLKQFAIRRLADVRRFPASRRHPHFTAPRLASALEAAGLTYRHFEDLGGRRSSRKDSRHTAWRVAGFRAYADHMETPEFQKALAHRLPAFARTENHHVIYDRGDLAGPGPNLMESPPG